MLRSFAAFALILALAPGSFTLAQMPMPAGAHHEAKPAVRSATLAVTVAGKTVSFSARELAALPQTSLTVVNGHSKTSETYTGVAVGTLLERCGLSLEGAGAKAVYQSYVRAAGTDGYWVVYSAAELEHGLRETGSVVALAVDGKPLAEDGAFKLVIAGEKKPARWVRNLNELRVVRAD